MNRPTRSEERADPLRASARDSAVRMLAEHLGAACAPGFFGKVELFLQDGIVETVRFERTQKVPRLKAAA